MKPYKEYDPTNDLSLAPTQRVKSGAGAKPLLEWEIKEAQKKARSAFEAARVLGVSYNTYKKWAKVYGIFEDLKNQAGLGISKINPMTGKKYNMEDVLNGMYPNYPLWKLKARLIKNGYVREECNCCGFNERRLTDHKVPLILDFLDSNKKNHSLDNMRVICFNCYFLQIGNLSGPKKIFYF
jgi:hypothetical protein